jgi:hypothetical protein
MFNKKKRKCHPHFLHGGMSQNPGFGFTQADFDSKPTKTNKNIFILK